MKKILLFVVLALTLAPAAAGAVSISVEPFGGLSYPVLQDDRKQGSQFGVRFEVSAVPVLTLEPYYGHGSYGDKTIQPPVGSPVTFDGGKVSSFGVNLLIETGTNMFKIYPFAGIASNKDERDTGDQTNTGYNFGAGVGFGLPAKLSVDVRGELQMIVTGDTSRKFGNATVGLRYSFLSLP